MNNESPFPEFDEQSEQGSVKEEEQGNNVPQGGYVPPVYTKVSKDNGEEKPKKTANNTVTLILTFVLAILSFFCGTIYSQSYKSEEEQLAAWIIRTIKQNSIYAENFTDEQWEALLSGMGKGAIEAGFIDTEIDIYSDFYSPAEIAEMQNEFTDGSRIGMGVSMIADPTNKYVLLYSVINGSPACSFVGKDSEGNEYKMQKGDRFYGISYFVDENGAVADEGEQVFVNFYEEGVTLTEIGSYFDRFKENEGFTLLMDRADENGSYGTIISFPAYLQSYAPEYSTFYDHTKLSVLPTDTALIQLTSFEKPSSKSFIRDMEAFKQGGYSNLILDMRGNGGGFVSEAKAICSYLVKDENNSRNTLMAYDVYAGGAEKKYYTDNNYFDSYFSESSKIIVLADSHSASATELTLMTMKYYGTVDVIIGENTYGKGITQQYFFQNPFKIEGFCLKITVSQLFDPSRNTIHGVGIAPDITVVQTEDSTVSNDDATILKAIEWLSNAAS
ncbi:MAG: hypothetical protein IJF71_06035 [Clostridia bacterium]|nr:hypothetical protein [Clostridia bacterium]